LYDAFLAPASLSTSQFSVLSVIDEHQELKAVELGKILLMERTTLLRNLRPLQDEGLIQTSRPDGARAHVFTLTPAGKARLEHATPYWEEAQQAFETEFGIERARRLRDDNLEISSVAGS
jgi:DNA-binding MarR family transcriptional regulator